MRRELRATLSLAWPVMVAEMGWMVMGLVDTVMVGPLGPAAIGAAGTGSAIFFAFMVFGIGTFFALDTFVSQNYGAGHLPECYRWLFAGIQLAVVLSVPLVLIGLVVVHFLPATGMQPEVLRLLQPYLSTLLWSAPPLLMHTVLRRYLQAIHVVLPITIVVVFANVVNAVANWVFVYGNLGMPALGTVGSAYATLAARAGLALMLWGVVIYDDRRRRGGLAATPFTLDGDRVRLLARLGMPAALQLTLEVGVFTAVAILAGRISAPVLAANQVVLNIASFFFMLPLGLSTAAAVRVGHAIGRGDLHGARRAGWSALIVALAIAAMNATVFVTIPSTLLTIFTREPTVLDVGVTLLLICAFFQPFDAFQTVATGALRGLGDTRTPMFVNLVGHWGVGLPVAYLLCFTRGWGVVGLWTGLSLSLTLIGVSLLVAWHWKSSEVITRGAIASRVRL